MRHTFRKFTSSEAATFYARADQMPSCLRESSLKDVEQSSRDLRPVLHVVLHGAIVAVHDGLTVVGRERGAVSPSTLQSVWSIQHFCICVGLRHGAVKGDDGNDAIPAFLPLSVQPLQNQLQPIATRLKPAWCLLSRLTAPPVRPTAHPVVLGPSGLVHRLDAPFPPH